MEIKDILDDYNEEIEDLEGKLEDYEDYEVLVGFDPQIRELIEETKTKIRQIRSWVYCIEKYEEK